MIYEHILYPYQKDVVDKLKNYNSGGLFTDTGTGKSYMSLSIYQDKVQKKLVNKCLVICLLGKIEEWESDFHKFFPFHRILILDGKDKTMREYRQGNWDVAIINFEKTWRCEDLIYYTNENTFILIDESHKIKQGKTKQGEFIARLGLKTPYKLCLTATPMEQGYYDLYNQFYFLGLINMTITQFEEMFCVFVLQFIPGLKRPFRKIQRYKNEKILDDLLSQYCVFLKREVSNELIPSEIMVDIKLDDKFKKIERERVYEDIVLDNVSSKRLGLKALCSGTIMGKTIIDNKTKCYQLNDYKIEWVKTFLETFNKRVIIFYTFTHQMEQLYEAIKKTKRSVARYNSEFKERDLFLNNDDCVILVQYKSGGTGIDWLKKGYVGIFYCLPDSYVEYYQAKGRIFRNGQDEKALFYILLANGEHSVDHLNYLALENKQDFNDEFYEKGGI